MKQRELKFRAIECEAFKSLGEAAKETANSMMDLNRSFWLLEYIVARQLMLIELDKCLITP